MAAKPDISREKLSPWDQYKDKQPDEALESIYAHVAATSSKICTWYWVSIRTKRKTSLAARFIAFVLLVLGTSLPIFAAIQVEAADKLLLTQSAVVLLAVAGLTQVADRVFGWSSGWVRYITTATTMENLTRAFELEWANHIVSKSAALESSDVKTLFELARLFEQALMNLQEDETKKWVAEFNSGGAILESLIKTQRKETDKKLESIRTTLSNQESAEAIEKKAGLPGSLEVTFTYKTGPEKLRIAFGEDSPVEFLGQTWAKLSAAPGQHLLKIQTFSEPPQTIEKIIEISPSGVALVEIEIPA